MQALGILSVNRSLNTRMSVLVHKNVSFSTLYQYFLGKKTRDGLMKAVQILQTHGFLSVLVCRINIIQRIFSLSNYLYA